MIPFEWTPEFKTPYEEFDEDEAARLDVALRVLLSGGHAQSSARRDRVQGDRGGAFIYAVRSGSGKIWHVYWDYTSPRRTAIVLLAPIEVER